MMKLLSFVTVTLLAVATEAVIVTTPLSKNGTVYMLALVPQNGTRIGPVCREAMQIVIDSVNANPTILPNHKLDVAFGNDQCDPEVGMSEYFRLVRLTRPASGVMLGSMCDAVCESVGVLPHIWSMIEVAAGCGTPVISPGPLYFSFHRVATPQDLFSRVRFWFFKKMGWKKVAVITEMYEILSRDAINFVKAATAEGIQVTTTEFYIYNIADKVNNLKKKDSRIILLNCGQTTCTQFFCEAYKVGLYGPKIVFILNNWIRLNASDTVTDCQPKDIEMVMEGSLFMGTLRGANEANMMTTLNYTVGEFDAELARRVNNYNDSEAWGNRTLCHDAALFGAHVMHEAEIAMRLANRSLSAFSSKDATVLPFIMSSAKKVSVTGLRGLLAISRNFTQEMLTPMEVAQKQGNTIKRAFLYYPNNDREPQTFDPLKWKTKENKPPRDSTTVYMRRTNLQPWLFSLMAALAAFGIAMAVLFAIMNFARRNARAIKMSSPKMNNLILYGSVLMLITVIVYPIEQTENVWKFCVARLVTFLTGFCMLFGSMFAKAWRVHQIFVKVIQRAEAVKDHRLMMFVACWVGVNWIIIAVWFGFDLMKALPVNTTVEVNETDADTIYQNWYYECTSEYQMYFSAAIAVIQGLLLFLGGFLAYETRKVHIEELNDSQSIGLCIYNIVVLAIVAVIAMFSAGDNLDLGYGIISGVILAGTLLAIFVIFLPKCPVYFGLAKAVDDVSVAQSKDTLGTGGGTRTTGTTSNEPHNISTGQSGPMK